MGSCLDRNCAEDVAPGHGANKSLADYAACAFEVLCRPVRGLRFHLFDPFEAVSLLRCRSVRQKTMLSALLTADSLFGVPLVNA